MWGVCPPGRGMLRVTEAWHAFVRCRRLLQRREATIARGGAAGAAAARPPKTLSMA